MARVKGYMRKVPGRAKKVRVKGHTRKKATKKRASKRKRR